MVAPDSIFDQVFMVPAEMRRDVFQEILRQSWSDENYVDVLIEMETEGALSARNVGRWLNAIDVGFGKFARLQGIKQPDLLIVEIGTGSFWTKLRKVNDLIALPGFLLGIYALVTQPDAVDEDTLRRVLAEQRPAATATCDLFLKDGVIEMRLSVDGRPLGTITRENAQEFRYRAHSLSGRPFNEEGPAIPAIPTWEAVLVPRPPKLEDEMLQLDSDSAQSRIAPPRPTIRDGMVMGTFLWIDRDPYVRLEGMEGVLVPVKAPLELLTTLQDRATYRFMGRYYARPDGLRTSFQMLEANPI